MARLIFLLLLVVVVYLLIKRLWPKPPVVQQRASPPEELMVACAHCGVNQPRSDSLLSDGQYYCCDAHRRLGPRK